jgi:membrane protein implicated in regulation of membrane protease activity
VIQVSATNAIFLLCLLVGGGLLLISVVLGDLVGDIASAFHIGLDIGGVSLMPPLLGFVSMFGVGGLFATQVFGMGAGGATLVGTGTGLVGGGLVFGLFKLFQRAEAPQAFSLNDLVGQTGRVAVAIPANRYGTVYVSFAGETHNLTATADRNLAAGTTVQVVGVAGGNLIVSAQRDSEPKGGGTSIAS